MENRRYSLTELLLDESFIEWAQNDSKDEWIHFKNVPEEEKENISKAKTIIKAQNFTQVQLSEEKISSIKSQIERNIKLKEDVNSNYPWFGIHTWLGRVAAIVIMISALTFVIYKFNSASQLDSAANVKPTKLINKKVPRGAKMPVTLSDGTVVKLNDDTELIYPEVFPANKREVLLEGEAYFKVVKDEKRPFIITSGNVKTTVLGTSFNIKAYKTDKTVKVALISGRVTLQTTNSFTKDSSIVLQPNEMFVYDKISKASTKTNFDPDKILAWKHKILLFENASFEEVIEQIERWYDVSFQIKYTGPIEHGFTASYENKPIKAVMEGVSFAFGFTYEIKDKVIIIK